MLLLSFLFFTYGSDLDINTFEVSQRLKGLGPEFSYIISDTVTDLIHEPVLTAFLPRSLLVTDFQASTNNAVSRAGYFSPSVFGGVSGGIYLEGGVTDLRDPVVYDEFLCNGWIRTIVSLSYLIPKWRSAVCVGGDITCGKNESACKFDDYPDYFDADTLLHKRNDCRIFASLARNSKRFPTRVMIEYEKRNRDFKDIRYKYLSHCFVDTAWFADTLVRIYEEWHEYLSDDRDEEGEAASLFGFTVVNGLFSSEKRKTTLFSSLRAGKEEWSESDAYCRYDSTIHKTTKIWDDSTTVECDTFVRNGANRSEHSEWEDLAREVSIGIGQENVLSANLSLFSGLKVSYSTRDGQERLSAPVAMEYRVSNSFWLRFGVTMHAARDHKSFVSSNVWHFGIRFTPMNALNVDMSNRGELGSINDWQLGVTKAF